MTGPAALVRVDREDDVATVTLDRPAARNAIDDDMLADLELVVDGLGRDASLRCVVVAAAGPAFCVGADLSAVSRRDPAANLAWNSRLAACLDAVAALPVPTVAAIQGAAMGGGLELALACTVRVAAYDARLALPEVRIGLVPGAGGMRRLPQLIGRARALHLLITGDALAAEEASDAGLVAAVVPGDDLLARARSIAERIAANGPLAVAAVLDVVGGDTGTAQAREAEHLQRLSQSDDLAEGIRAFLGKRSPRFAGR